MLKFKLVPLVGVLAMGAFIAAGARSARASEITFGNPTLPSAGTCATSHTAGDEGEICNNGLQFTAPDGTTLTANGYSNNAFLTSNGTDSSTATALTLKIDGQHGNGQDESGLGENATGVVGSPNSTSCTDNPGGVSPSSTPCEIGVGAAVTVTSNGTLISDVLVGSVQASFEEFQVWTDINGTWSQFGPDLSLNGDVGSSSACNKVDSLSECQINLTTAATAVGVVELAGNAPSELTPHGCVARTSSPDRPWPPGHSGRLRHPVRRQALGTQQEAPAARRRRYRARCRLTRRLIRKNNQSP